MKRSNPVFLRALGPKSKHGHRSIRYDGFVIDKSRFEVESWKDIVRVPVSYFRWLKSLVMYHFIYWGDLIKKHPMPGQRGRREDWTPSVCCWCMWAGPVKNMIHTYADAGDGDVCGVSECPICQNEL